MHWEIGPEPTESWISFFLNAACTPGKEAGSRGEGQAAVLRMWNEVNSQSSLRKERMLLTHRKNANVH